MEGTRILLIVTISLCTRFVVAQSCDCPPAGSCGPCAGGFTSLTLRFNGVATSTILVSDQIGDVFNASVAPGGAFTFVGSIPNDKFAGPSVSVRVNSVLNTTINSTCGGGTTVGSVFGSFTIVAAVSKTGGAVCCTAGLEDATPPTISNCPSNIAVPLGTSCTIPVTWSAPTASDNCSVASFVASALPGSEFGLGTTPVTYTATDTYGNTATCKFNVVITDVTPPVFTNCPANVVVAAAVNCKGVANWTEPISTDNCGVVTLEKSHSPGDEFELGTTVVAYRATDAAGNTTLCTFTVRVEDTLAPTFTTCTPNITLPVTDACTVAVDWIAPVVQDNCSLVSVVSTHVPGVELTPGITAVTYTATDGSGNTATCTFTITVTVAKPPEVDGCPGNLRAVADETGEASVSWTEPIFTAQCGAVTVETSNSPGSRFATGDTEVVYTAKDEYNNTASCRFVITVTQPLLELEISKLITPNGDGFNDVWAVTNVENYPDNTVTILDRWGSVLFRASGYDNESVVWRGVNKSNQVVPTGTYFYVLEFTLGNQKVKREGFIELVR